MKNSPKPRDKKFLVGNFMSSYMPLAKPPAHDLKRIALPSEQLQKRLQARTDRRVQRTKGYNRFRLAGSLVVFAIMALGLYASLTTTAPSTQTAQTPASTQQVTPSASSVSTTTPIPALFQ
jgi:hypothetical protein